MKVNWKVDNARPKHEELFASALLVMQLSGVALLYKSGLTWVLGASLVLTLAALCVYDLRLFILPDTLTLPLLMTGLAAELLAPGTDGASLEARLAGAAGGYGVLYLLNKLYRAWRGRDGLGMGDAKLMAAAGAWLGVGALPFVLLIASALGLAVGLSIMLITRQQKEYAVLPFGPFISTAFLLLWFFPVRDIGN